jgi:hypothetical protein
MEKDLIIGAFSNYNDFNVLKPWVYSIKETGFQGDIVLIAVNVSDEICNTLVNEGVQVVKVVDNNKMMIHMLRFIHIYNFLKNNHKNYRYVISTDVRDVIFQKNPIDYLVNEEEINLYVNLIGSSEAIRIKNEKWNRENIQKNFGDYWYNEVKDNLVCNVGILAGNAIMMKDLCFYLFQMSLNRPDWVADQAAYNTLLAFEPFKSTIDVKTLKDAWALNAHVTNKPDQLQEFGPFLEEGRPIFQDGKIKNEFGQEFVIVHQYDRVPEWAEFIMKKYDVNITKDTNTGTSPKYFIYKT